jgi:hypothetical protein
MPDTLSSLRRYIGKRFGLIFLSLVLAGGLVFVAGWRLITTSGSQTTSTVWIGKSAAATIGDLTLYPRPTSAALYYEGIYSDTVPKNSKWYIDNLRDFPWNKCGGLETRNPWATPTHPSTTESGSPSRALALAAEKSKHMVTLDHSYLVFFLQQGAVSHEDCVAEGSGQVTDLGGNVTVTSPVVGSAQNNYLSELRVTMSTPPDRGSVLMKEILPAFFSLALGILVTELWRGYRPGQR